MRPPLVSVVIATLNAMPHLQRAIAALEAQTFRDFEIVIQDGGSTDDTLSYLESAAQRLPISISSEPDSGIGQAYNRGMQRCSGTFVSLSASDEQLLPHSLEMAVRWYEQHPEAVHIYGGVLIVDADDRVIQRYDPFPFHLASFLKMEELPSIGLLNRPRIGDDFYYDERLATCGDYDFFVRLGVRFGDARCIAMPEIFYTSLGTTTSMSVRPESYRQFCKDKLTVLDRYVEPYTHTTNGVLSSLATEARAAIYCWGAEMGRSLDAPDVALDLIAAALRIDSRSPRARRFVRSLGQDDLGRLKAMTTGDARILPPAEEIVRVEPNPLAADMFRSADAGWESHIVPLPAGEIEVRAGSSPWGYAAEIPIHEAIKSLDPLRQYAVELKVTPVAGRIAIGLRTKSDQFVSESYFLPATDPVVIAMPLETHRDLFLTVRNGGKPNSAVRVHDVALIYSGGTP